MSVFSKFHPRLQHGIVNRLGWASLRPVQDVAGNAILEGNNAVILAPTAGGKTEASFFPTISRILEDDRPGVRIIYVSPLKALINNQEERLGIYTEMVGFSRFKWHGDVTQTQRNRFLEEPSELLMTTPESLEVMLISSKVPAAKLFKNLSFVIIDEVHALAAGDRGGHLLAVMERMRAFASDDYQRIGLSATVGNPTGILEWMKGSSTNSGVVVDPPKPPSSKEILVDIVADDFQLSREVLKKAIGAKSLLFCEQRALTEELADRLNERGVSVFVHHSSLSKEERMRAEAQFADGQNVCIICTSTLELGIDIGDLDKIFQAESPATVSAFLQRLGRTGRREQTTANMTFFPSSDSALLQALAIVQLASRHWVEDVRPSSRAWHLLVHQLMALCLQHGGISRNESWARLSPCYCFSGISEQEFHGLIEFLLSNDILFEESGWLSMGERAERVFGRNNFMEMYSVFSSPREIEILTVGGRALGSIEEEFLDRIIDSETSFLLAGEAWIIERVERRQARAYVSVAPAGRKPKWGGFLPHLLGKEISREMYSILTSDEDLTYLSPSSKSALEFLRSDRGQFLSSHYAPMQELRDELLWWTYAGGRVNNTLKFVLERETGYKISVSNERLKVESDGLSSQYFLQAVRKVSSESYWSLEETKRAIISLMPQYRLSKFQFCLPDEYQQELIAYWLLDVPGTREFLDRYLSD